MSHCASGKHKPCDLKRIGTVGDEHRSGYSEMKSWKGLGSITFDVMVNRVSGTPWSTIEQGISARDKIEEQSLRNKDFLIKVDIF